jgi:hypothetical protein
VLIAHHAGVAVGLEADFGSRIGAEFLAGFQDDGAFEVVGLLAGGDVQRSLGVQRRLDGLRPYFGGDVASIGRSVAAGPFLGLFFRAHELLEIGQFPGGVAWTGETAAAVGGGKVRSFCDPEGNLVQIVARSTDESCPPA